MAIGFMQTARPFVLEKNNSNSDSMLVKLKEARRNLSLVTILLSPGTNRIIDILPDSKVTSDRFKSEVFAESSSTGTFKKLKVSTQNVNLNNIIPDVATLNSLFNQMNSPAIPFQFAVDGCYARAHKMRQILNKQGYECEKLFAFGAFLTTNSLAGCCVQWDWHVAPLVSYRNSQGYVS